MVVVVHTELVKSGVAVRCARPRMLCTGHIEATDEHEVAVLRVPAVLQRLAWVRCTVDAPTEHALRCKTHARPASCLNVGYNCLRRAVEEKGVGLARVRTHRVDVKCA